MMSKTDSEKYKVNNILNKFKDLAKKKPYLSASYVLTEVSQSILETKSVKAEYKILKNKLIQELKIPETISSSSKKYSSGKCFGKYLMNQKIKNEEVVEIARKYINDKTMNDLTKRVSKLDLTNVWVLRK